MTCTVHLEDDWEGREGREGKQNNLRRTVHELFIHATADRHGVEQRAVAWGQGGEQRNASDACWESYSPGAFCIAELLQQSLALWQSDDWWQLCVFRCLIWIHPSSLGPQPILPLGWSSRSPSQGEVGSSTHFPPPPRPKFLPPTPPRPARESGSLSVLRLWHGNVTPSQEGAVNVGTGSWHSVGPHCAPAQLCARPDPHVRGTNCERYWLPARVPVFPG